MDLPTSTAGTGAADPAPATLPDTGILPDSPPPFVGGGDGPASGEPGLAGPGPQASELLLRYRWAAPLALVACSALVAVAWYASPASRSDDPALAGDDDASVVAGDPSPSMLAAVEAVGAEPTEPPSVLEIDATGERSTEAEAADGTAAPDEPPPTGQPSDAGQPAEEAAPATDGTEPAVGGPAADAPPATGPSGSGSAPASGSGSGSAPGAGPGPPAPPSRPTRVFPVTRTDRLTTAELVGLVERNDITNVADFLSILPPFMGESFTLMEDSRSRHLASTEYPRLIMYGPDARLLIGVSSHPSDPLREVVELAELDESTGLWRFSQLDFRGAFLHDTATQGCAGCHGSPQRPIWGEYPDWTGAFAGDDERLTGGQVASLMRLKTDPIDRFHHLVFPSDHSIRNNGQLYLPSREYGYANTSFNFELNAAVADGLARRLLAHPNWERDGHQLLAMQWRCDGRSDPAQRDALYNRFGIDGTNDFQLESPVFEATTDQRNEYDWNQGSTGLDDSVAFRTLDLAAERDPTLRAIVESGPLFGELSYAWFDVLGAARADFLRINGIDEIDFRPQNLRGGFVSQVCAHLESQGA